jgi:hypothetical protein
MTCEPDREADDLILDGSLEPLQRLHERRGECREPLDARRELGLAGCEALLVAAVRP